MLIKNYTLLRLLVILLYFCKSHINAEYLLPCKEDTDCKEIKGSTCENDFCKCPIDELFSGNMTVCLKVALGYGSPCEESQQCSNWLLIGSECSNGQCTCSSGYHYRNGRCYKTKGIGESCENDLECFDGYDIEALQCTKGICQCSSNYHFRLNTDCRRIGKDVGDPCVIDTDCLFVNATCNKNFVCSPASPAKHTGLGDTEDTNNFIEKPSARSNQLANDPILGSECKKNEDCNVAVKNSVCFGTCRCDRKYMADLTKDECIPELGTETDDAKYCSSLRNSEYRDGKCLCRVGFSYISNKECLKPTRQLNYSCTRDENCHTFGPAAICKSKRCECNKKSWYDKSSMICRMMKGIGDTCVDDIDCHLEPSVSPVSPICGTDKKCSCPKKSYPADNDQICQPTEVGIGDHCSQPSDCIVRNSDCIDNVCTCSDTYYFNKESNLCLPGIGAKCTEDSDCTIKNSICAEKIKKCECEQNYTYAETKCYKGTGYSGPQYWGPEYPVPKSLVASSYNDTCDIDEQCQAVFNKDSSCQKGYCLCNKNHHFRNGKCWEIRLLGQSCTRDGQCYVNTEESSVECRNSQCQCSLGYVKNSNNLGCSRREEYRNSGMKNSVIIFLIVLSMLNIL